jgi:hypothetical protein
MDIDASVAGPYRLGGPISWHQVFSVGILPIPHLHKYMNVSGRLAATLFETSLQISKLTKSIVYSTFS